MTEKQCNCNQLKEFDLKVNSLELYLLESSLEKALEEYKSFSGFPVRPEAENLLKRLKESQC